MSLPRSIDRTDLSGATVSLPNGAETLVLVGPQLQTPKDTSIVVVIGCVAMNLPAAVTDIVLGFRRWTGALGATVAGPFYVWQPSGAGETSATAMFSIPSNSTDYVTFALTATVQGGSGAGGVTAATILAISF